MKKLIMPMSVLAIMLLIVVVTFINQTEKRNVPLDGLVGQALYKTWEGYTRILEAPEGPPNEEVIHDMHSHLISVQAYSNMVDLAVGTQLLHHIADDLLALQQTINPVSPDPTDRERYTFIINNITTLLPLITDTYYVPSHHGGKPNFNVTNAQAEQLIELRDRLRQTIKEVSAG
ncbi:hypothetical protein [Paenibacillus sp. 1P07SE]|uniref:hypothetical protein n=1 Tax=Paenibacillus sp. 1P07SE TaxID=3132209 RepID=UPI0039A58C8E